MHNPGAMRRGNAPGRHHQRKRAIQYSEASVIEPRSCGVLDTSVSRSMTTSCEARLSEIGPATTGNDAWRNALPQHDPRRSMVAGAFLAAQLAVDAGLDQARRQHRAQQEMIEPQSRVARPSVAFVIPEREHRF